MTHLANVVKQAIERSQKFDGNSASQWTSAECRAVHAGVHSARDAIRRQDRTQRRKRVTILFLSRGCQRTKGASMKRILQRQQPPLSFMPVVVLRAGVRAGELQSAFPRFRAAIAEECFLKPRDLCELFRQLGLILVEEQVGNMD